MDPVLGAIELSRRAHEGQFRKYAPPGHPLIPYFVHPCEVAQKVGKLPDATEVMICAAYLHDVIEDTPTPHEDIVKACAPIGEEVLAMVLELTNPTATDMELKKKPRRERKQIDRDHLAGSSREARQIKLVDRICNLADMDLAPDSFKRIYVDESLQLFRALLNTDLVLELELAVAIDKLKASLGG